MIIENSSITMTSSHKYRETDVRQEKLNFWVGSSTPLNVGDSTLPELIPQDQLDISEEAKKALRCENESEPLLITSEDEAKLRLIQILIEKFTGKKIRIFIPRFHNYKEHLDMEKLRKIQVQAASERAGWGLDYSVSHTHTEKENTSFNSSGVIKTFDGRKIQFSVDLNLSRQFISHEHIHIRAGDAKLIDPLVINFDAPAAALTNTKYFFDLDFDGRNDNISFVKPGSGFLALDINEDGIINNGKELFGPQTGNGFTELSLFDKDNNGWIDENDPIYEKLRIWTKDKKGNDVLFALGQKGIGAIYLGNVNTQFSLQDSIGNKHGQIRQTGIFLRENGTAGTVQEIDLSI